MRDFAPAPVFDGTAVRYYESGEAMFPDLLAALESAEHSIYVESFIIGMGEMWGRIHEILRRKAAAGVDVRVIYDDAGCLSLLPHNYAETLRAEGIRAFSFNPFVPVFKPGHEQPRPPQDHRRRRAHRLLPAASTWLMSTSQARAVRLLEGQRRPDGRPRRAQLCQHLFGVLESPLPEEPMDLPELLPEPAPQPTDCLVQPFADSPADRETVAKNVYLDLIAQAQRGCTSARPT